MRRQHELKLQLARGECRRILVEAGSELVLIDGRARVRQPPCWLADSVQVAEFALAAEEMRRVEEGGWIEVQAAEAATLLVIGPGGQGWWQGLLACLGWRRTGASRIA